MYVGGVRRSRRNIEGTERQRLYGRPKYPTQSWPLRCCNEGAPNFGWGIFRVSSLKQGNHVIFYCIVPSVAGVSRARARDTSSRLTRRHVTAPSFEGVAK